MSVISAVLLVYAGFLVLFMFFSLFRKRRGCQPLVIGLAQLVIIIPLLIWSLLPDDSSDILWIEDAQYQTESYESLDLSDEQAILVDVYGYPAGFSILYAGESFQDRMETWYYPEDSLTVEFYNGLLLAAYTDDSLGGVSGGPFRVTPETLVYGITPGTALAAAGVDQFALVPAEDALLEDATLYFGTDIVLGFIDDRLCYAETLAAER